MIVNLKEQHCENFLQSLHKEQWQKVRLGEVAEIVNGGTPKTSIPEYWNGEIPWLTPKDLAGYKHIYISRGERFITELGLKNSSATLMPKGTILLSSRAPIGYVAIAQNDICTNQGFKSLIVNPKQAHNLFVYYWIKNNVEYLQFLGTGTTFEEISKSVVQDIIIPLPPLAIQQKIAEILSSFDDKIDLLHRQNKTLESLALTLFRHYFIDNPKRDEWELGKLGDYVKIVYGKNLPTKNLLPQGYAVFGGNGKIGYFDQYLYDEPQVLISCRGEASGKVNISERKSFITNNSLVLERTKDKEITFEYLKYYCLSYNFDTFVSGSAQPQITIDGLHNAEFIKANQNDILKFSGIISNFENKIENNSKQIQNLQAMREVLLKAIFA